VKRVPATFIPPILLDNRGSAACCGEWMAGNDDFLFQLDSRGQGRPLGTAAQPQCSPSAPVPLDGRADEYLRARRLLPRGAARNNGAISAKTASAVRVFWKLDVNDPASMDESRFRAPGGAWPISKTFWMNRYFVPRRNLIFQFL
jgi:hypothetical protein